MKRKVAVGIALFLIGIVSLFFSVSSQVYGYIDNHSNRTSENIQGIDKNISKVISTYRETLEYIVEHATYEEENLLSKDKMVDDMLIVEQNKIIFSKDGKFDYEFEKISEVSNMYWSIDESGEYNLAIAYIAKKQEERSYIILLDLEEFYKDVATEKNQPHDGVILVDVSGKLTLNSWKDEIFIEPVELVKAESVQAVLTVHDEMEERLLHFERLDPRTREKQTKYIRALPVGGTENGLFTISVKVLIGDELHNIRQMTMLALGSGVCVAVGIGLLIKVSVETWHKSKRQKEELQEVAHRQRLETIGILTAGVAHEFSNLLTPIMGYSVMALEKLPEENEEVYDNLVEIYNAALKAKDVIERLSNLSRKKEGTTYEMVSIDEVVDKTLNVVKSAQPKTVTIHTKLKCREQNVWGNETLLMQMMMNLILNAFHASERKEESSVTISTEVCEEHVRILVNDNGAGIPDKIQSKIFEPFFTTKQTMKGTGLGLAIVQQIVDAHNGRIQVESEEGKWTTFTITLPLGKENIES